MAATRVIRADSQDADSVGLPVLERLQYPSAQPARTLDDSSAKTSHHGAKSANAWVAMFPDHVDGFSGSENSRATDGRPDPQSDAHRAIAELERRLQDERAATAQAVAAALEQGRREERHAVEQQLNSGQQRLQAQLAQSLEQFRLERQIYFHNVEGEVVRLALAIASRVLHREANLDPLLLTGAVRVALEKLGDSSHVVMRVPPREVETWKEFFRVGNNVRIQPGILEDPSLTPGECMLVTELGTIELGVRAQLEEIEKGFFDLLDRRPAESSTNTATALPRSAV